MINAFQNVDSARLMVPPAQAFRGDRQVLSYSSRPLTSGRLPIESNFAIFGMLFAAWVLIDQSFFPQWMNSYPSLFTAPLAAAVLLRPNNVKLFLSLMLASLWSFWWKSPFYVNNVFIGAFFASLILISAAIYTIRNRHLPRSLCDLEASCFPTIRVGVIAIFLFAVLHKTNSAFLDPSISCAVIHYNKMRKLAPFLPSLQSDWSKHFVIWLTWCTEAGIPFLLTLGWMKLPSRKLITVAIIVALGFHFVMSFNGYQNFSMMALAYYVPFLPIGFYRSISAFILRVKRSDKLATVLRTFGYLAAIGIVVFATELFLFAVIKIARPGVILRGERFLRDEGWVLFNFAAAPLVMIGFAWLSWQRFGRSNKLAGGKLPAWTFLLLAIVALSSLSPYLGLKTENSFAMFSNLRTEGPLEDWNQSFLPTKMRVFPFQDNLITVKKANWQGKIPRLADGKFQIVEFEFRREMAIACRESDKPLEIDYEVNGRPVHVDDAHKVPELSQGNGFLLEKLMFFRLIPNDPRGICLH